MTPSVMVAGSTCLLTSAPGADLGEDELDGLFVDDCRHLSTLALRVHGRPLRTLRSSGTTSVAIPDTPRGSNPPFAVHRQREVTAGRLVETLTLQSYVNEPQTVRLGYHLATDFADQFELRSDRVFDKSDAVRTTTLDGDGLILAYERRGFRRSTTVTAAPAARLTTDSAEWTLTLAPHGSASVSLTVDAGRPAPSMEASPPMPHVARDDLARCVRRGLADLDALRVKVPGLPTGAHVPAAGAPWFLTVFGRDSLISSLFALPYRPELAAGTLRALGAFLGGRNDPARVEEPGKVVHELRFGELATLGEVPYGRYYGTVDATPLFLALLAAYHELTGDDVLAKALEGPARAAAGWVCRQLDARGYLTYRTDGPGLVHQCWKDSADSIVFRDGTPAAGPIAVSEAQAYAYRGLLGTARIAEQVWGDASWAGELTARAHALQTRFAADFRLPDGFVALALDGSGRAVDALASNAGHVLWSSIIADDWATAVGRRLAQDDFFSGWGVRTLAEGQAPYHPLSYHRGGVWPHDTAFAVAGLVAAGRRDDAARIAEGLLAAAAYYDDRLPEVLTGLPRIANDGPVPYPHSCSPQAWAAASPLALLTALG
ncbi:Glycogen debranching enzyme (alpha-1,6-glucosidase) [Micromonospora rhizosphaerae]|uniref:Glycogen debranching enzyme (Alpha-1,6-glucosidase) n=1 Tax=Micromonospora rhizosphaerae TaxID=568872 RepID=A0A1C6T1B4_9ACTN|nr:glycogen debranching N-terminal domain-containing protein [Micromonospora rhizosphaerae]SCL35624.1 Glycogen debranching enzyme (alpha-1,6-glucosidase) [Micromonospora rhizosphaerae]